MSEKVIDIYVTPVDGVIPPSSFLSIEKTILEFESPVIVSVKKKRKRTSKSQRGYYFAAIVSEYIRGALEAWGEYLSKQEAHDNLKKECNFKEVIINEDEIVRIVLSTESLNSLERETYHEKCRNLIYNYFNIVCLLPNEQADIDY